MSWPFCTCTPRHAVRRALGRPQGYGTHLSLLIAAGSLQPAIHCNSEFRSKFWHWGHDSGCGWHIKLGAADLIKHCHLYEFPSELKLPVSLIPFLWHIQSNGEPFGCSCDEERDNSCPLWMMYWVLFCFVMLIDVLHPRVLNEPIPKLVSKKSLYCYYPGSSVWNGHDIIYNTAVCLPFLMDWPFTTITYDSGGLRFHDLTVCNQSINTRGLTRQEECLETNMLFPCPPVQ